MITEKEWKAINNLKFIIVTDIYDNEVRIDKTKIINEYNESVGIVLNLISKLQTEITALNMTHKYDTDMIEEVKGEAVKQDKVIDATTKYIASLDTDEDICKKMHPNNTCEDNGIPCKDCIKQYFYRKVEDANSI